MKIEEGVMVMKNGKAWGEWSDNSGPGSSSGGCWMEPENASIRDPRYCKRPTDVVWEGSPDRRELETAKLCKVRRTTTVEVLGEYVTL